MAQKIDPRKNKIRFSSDPIKKWHKKIKQFSDCAEIYEGNNWLTVRFDGNNEVLDPFWYDHYFWIYDDLVVSYLDWKKFTKISDEEELLLKMSLNPSTNK